MPTQRDVLAFLGGSCNSVSSRKSQKRSFELSIRPDVVQLNTSLASNSQARRHIMHTE